MVKSGEQNLGESGGLKKCRKINGFSNQEFPKNLPIFPKNDFWENWGKFGKSKERMSGMRKVNYKGRCTKRKLSKCKDVCRTFDVIQLKTAEIESFSHATESPSGKTYT